VQETAHRLGVLTLDMWIGTDAQSWLIAGAGLFLLMAGGHLVVREAATLAARLGVSALVIGVVVIGFGTSAPELATGVGAAITDAPALAFGNAVGASMANLLLVLPIAGLMLPIAVPRDAIRAEAMALVGAAALFAGLAFLPGAARAGGVLMIMLLLGWLAFSLTQQASGRAPTAEAGLQQREGETLVIGAEPFGRALLLLLTGIAALVAGADLLVTAATGVARRLGIGEDVLGLTLLSFGTCLPELATAVIAARRRETDIVVGNVLGSCLFNLLAVAGTVQAITATGPVGKARDLDGPALLLAAGLVVAILLGRQRLGRTGAAFLMACYVTWLALRLHG
jgi:cation:H+ antiporter